jgi:antitoxin MazE
MDVKISKWGNSQGIRIPLSVLEQMGINDPVGESVSITVNSDGTAILKHKSMSYADLFRGVDLHEYETDSTHNGIFENRMSGNVGAEDSID